MPSLPVTPQGIAKAIQDLLDENARLKARLNAAGAGVKINAKKLNRSEVREIRQLWRTSGLTQKEIAEMYDINPATVSRIVRGHYHAKVGA